MKIIQTDFKYALDSMFLSKMHIFQLLAQMTIMNSSVLPIIKKETHIDHYSRLNPVTAIRKSIVHEDWLTCKEFYIAFDPHLTYTDDGYIRISLPKCL